MDFEWDPAKEAANIAKHGLSFVATIAVFGDPNCIVTDSTRPEHGETRRKAIGRIAQGHVIVVIYTDRGAVRRIISARKVRKNEQTISEQAQDDPG